MNKTLTVAIALAFSSFVSANEVEPANAQAVVINTAEVTPVAKASTEMTDATTSEIKKDATAEVTFEALDTDNDGQISEAEVVNDQALLVSFAKLDLDQDGKLSEEEYSKFIG